MATHWPEARALARSGSSSMMPVPGHWQKKVEGRPAASGGAGPVAPGAANGPSQGQGPAGQATLGAGGSAGAYGMASCQHAPGGLQVSG